MSRQLSDRGGGRKNAPVAAVADGTADTLRTIFGQNFRLARERAGLTQSDIETQTGIKQHYVSQIENGRQNLTLDTMTALALAVGRDVRTLLRPPSERPSSGRPPSGRPK
jgi:DNA-binding XRE family transcriptional regulator